MTAGILDRVAAGLRDRAGDCGTDLHDHGVEKVYVADPTGDGCEGLTLEESVLPTGNPDRPTGETDR